jgi:hypothetical membrane protein
LLAPVLLIGGWTVAAALQPGGFDSLDGTISALAGLGASSRWVMALAILGTGVCHMVTALALHPAAVVGRRVLALGGLATVLVACFPLPAVGTTSWTSSAHALTALAAFVLLSVWGVPARRYGSGVPWGLRSPVALRAAAVLCSLTALFFVAVSASTAYVGLLERVAAGAQALWPLAVVLSVTRARAR